MKNNSGFMALMSTIIISVILLLIATSLSLTSFYGRTNILDFELKEKSFALAEACADTAILRLAEDSSYGGNETVNVVGADKCQIESVVGGTINVKADYKNYITKLEIEINSTDLSIISWQEVL